MAYTTIDKPSDFFNTVLYTGNATSRTISGIGFQPDWVLGKSRTNTENNTTFDAVRGVTKDMKTDGTNAEASNSGITAFNSDGYVIGTADSLNSNGQSFVTWNWKANGAGASNEEGSINTIKTSANTTSGFSISTFTGTGANGTFGHGLGVAPSVVIVKRTNTTGDWVMYHESLGNTKNMRLPDSGTVDTNSTFLNSTTPTSSLVSLGSFAETNTSSDTYVAYCFSPIKGFSAMGSYVGNGEPTDDAPFIYTGFKPAFTLIKSSTFAEPWFINDNKRSVTGGNNPNSYYLRPNTTEAEGTSTSLTIDLLSNGIKLQNNDNAYNKNTQSYIYMCFAENPFVTATGIPSTAK